MTTNKDKQREAFEEWASGEVDLTRLEDGSYLYEDPRCMWVAWQAAQEAIRLPDQQTKVGEGTEYELGYRDGYNMFRADFIRLNGLGDK